MTAGPLVEAALLNNEPAVDPPASEDVLDRVASPGATMRNALAVQDGGHLGDRVRGQLLPDAPDHAGLLRHDDELAGVGQSTGFVSQAPIAEWVVTTVAAVLEEAPLHPGHPLGVEIALELGRDAQLPEHQSPRCPVERRVRQVRDEQGHVLAVELVAQVEHESSIPGET